MIPRTLTNTIIKNHKSGFINLIYGPRRVGKTFLLKQLAQAVSKPGVWFDGDHQETRDVLSNTSQTVLKKLVEHNHIVFIDEAQRIPNIGLSLKILIDTFPEKTFYVTGSSSLMLSRGIQEPLTGRTQKYRLFPLSTQELTLNIPNFQKSSLISNQLIFGGYPYLTQLSKSDEKKNYLKSITQDYLFKDIFLLKTIILPETIKKLASLLAFQIGSEVSLNELSSTLGIDIKTVYRYITLLKESFVIFDLGAYSKNLRKEISKGKKYYFFDLGIRNALVDQFFDLDTRTDIGGLWENFLAIERIKKHEYSRKLADYYFWRTYEQAEIDWIEILDGKLSAYEFKWKKAKPKTPKAFKETYKINAKLITKENYLDFIT